MARAARRPLRRAGGFRSAELARLCARTSEYPLRLAGRFLADLRSVGRRDHARPVAAAVKRFTAEVSIPKQGLCRFDIKNFRQTAKLPNVVLTDAQSTCVVRMWEQEKGVTVAFNACESKCSGDAFSYLWPILVDTRNGRCS